MAFFFLCVAIFIMFFQPGFVFPWMEQYQPLKNSAILALVTYILWGKKSSVPFWHDRTNIFFVVFVLMQIASAAQLWWFTAWESFNFWVRMGIVYYLIVKSVTTEKKVVFLCATIISAIVYLSWFSVSSFVVNYIPGTRAGGFGWYEGANDLAIILVSVIPLCLLVAFIISNKILKILFVVIAAFFAFNLLFTGSRNGLLGLVAVGAVSLLSFKKVSAFVRVILIIVLLGAVVTVGMRNVLSRSDLDSGVSGDASSEDRILQWKACLRMLQSKFLLGVGPNEFENLAADYGGIRGLPPHNTILQIFAETGLLGGISFLIFSFSPFFSIKKFNKVKHNCVFMLKFVVISLLGFWTCAFFSNRYQFYLLYVLVAASVAIKVNLCKNLKE